MEIHVESLEIPSGTEVVRGYNETIEFNVTLLNLNTSLDVVLLELPDMNFNLSLYLTDDVMTRDATPPVTMPLEVDMNTSDVIQFVAAGGEGILRGEAAILVPRDTCADYTHFCVKVVPAEGSSYKNPHTFQDYILCVDASSVVNCEGKLPSWVDFTGPALVVVNQTVTFNISWVIATDINIDITYGDGGTYHWNWLDSDHVTSYGEHNVTTDYVFAHHGNYSVTCTLSNDVGEVSNDTVVAVEPYLNVSAKIYVFSSPRPSPALVQFAVEHMDANSSAAIVWCHVVYGDGSDNGTLFGVISENAPLLFDHLYTTEEPDVTSEITCYNHYSSISKSQLVILRADFRGLNLSVNSDLPAFPIDTDVPLKVEMTNGSHAQFRVDMGNDVIENYTHPNRLSYEEMFTFVHSFPTHGNYTLEVYVWNEHFNATTNTTLIVQNPVHTLTTSGPTHVAYPPGFAAFVAEPEDATLPTPDEVFCERQMAAGVTDLVYDTFIGDNLASNFDFTYGLDHVTGSQIQVNVTCYNLVSRQTASWKVEVHEVIGGLAAILDPPYVGRGEEFILRLSLTNGSTVTYDVDWGDSSPLANGVHPHLFANDSLYAFSHVFSTVGNFTLTITPWNAISNVTDDTYEVLVQNRMVDLELTTNTSVLWPDGLVHFTVRPGPGQNPLSQVHCVWDYNSEEVVYTYIDVLDASNPFLTQYEFPRSSIGLANVTVNCSNLISNLTLYTSVEIILDQVILGDLQENGTVWWQNISMFSLDIRRFGTWACYQWNMGDGGESHVVYGVRSCEEYATANGYQFVEIDYDNLTITHRHEYDWPGTYNVTVVGRNHVNNVTRNVTHTVLDWLCYNPNISVIPEVFNDTGISYVHMKSKEFSLVANYTQYCWKSLETRYKWTIIEEVTETPVIEVESNTTFHYTSRLLNYGLYVARFYVTMHSDNPRYIVDGVDANYDVYIDVIATPLRVKIASGMADGAAYDRRKEVNAIDTTFDPDTDPSDKSGLEFMWFCKLAEEDWIMEGEWVSRAPPSGSGGCYGKGSGPMGQTEGSFVIDTKLMKANTLYHIRVEGSKDTRRAFYQQEFYVGASDPPVITSE